MFKNSNQKSSMECEIFEQPKILSNILNTYVSGEEIKITLPENINKVVLVASGSSYNCARFAADLFGNVAQIEARAIYSSEFLLKSAVPHAEDILYVFITQSGETSDTNKALNKAKQFGVQTLCVTNKKDSTIWQASDFKIDCMAGEEKSIAATKSLSAQMLCLSLIILKYAKFKGIDITNHLKNLSSLPEVLEDTLEHKDCLSEMAAFLSKFQNIIVAADGISYAIAREACLKIKETSYINISSSILGEFMHGHVAVLNNKAALLYISVDDMSYTAIKNLNKIIEEYDTPICVIGQSNSQVETKFVVEVNYESELVKSFACIVLIQLLALEIAYKLKRNVDKPHGLNKVVQ